MPVEFKNLQCVRPRTGFELRPLEDLEVFDHVHGIVSLHLDDDGFSVNNFGTWTYNDACLGQWLEVFTELHALIDSGGTFTYEFPYPDQGEPRLEFIFTDDLVRIVTTLYADDGCTEAEEVWEQSAPRVRFEPLVGEALMLIEKTILEASPVNGPAWLARQRGG